jgi:hypothetical protein
MSRVRVSALVLLGLLAIAHPVQADWLLMPFAGVTAGVETAFLDLDGVAGGSHAAFGVALTLFPERVLGIDVETSTTPSIFTGHDLVESSRLLTLTGSIVIALPRSWSRVVRPYALAGAGLIHVAREDIAGIFPIDATDPAASVGAGVWLPMTRRLGARVETRFMRSLSDSSSSRVEMWRTTAGVTVGL